MNFTTFMALAGGIPTFISLGIFLIAVLFLSKKKSISIKKLKHMKASAKQGNIAYDKIKKLLPTCPPLTRFMFRISVGKKRWTDYNYQG